MMSTSTDDCPFLEEVQTALKEIENKYLITPITPKKNSFKESLVVLSEEFDSVGIPPINLEESSSKIFKQVINNARSLIHMYRKTATRIIDFNIERRLKDSHSHELYQKIDDYKENIKKHKEQILSLQSEISKLNDEKKELYKMKTSLKSEIERTKRYYLVRQNELEREVKKVLRENEKLKEKIEKYISSNGSNESTMMFLNEWKVKEDIYKSTIQQLQNNNKELIEEICNLKEDILLQKNK